MSKQSHQLIQASERDKGSFVGGSHAPHGVSSSRAGSEGVSEYGQFDDPPSRGIRNTFGNLGSSSQASPKASRHQDHRGKPPRKTDRQQPRYRGSKSHPDQPNQLEALVSERNYYKAKHAEAEEALIKCNAGATELSHEIFSLREENEQIRKAAEKLQLIMSKKDIFFGEQLPDQIIRSGFSALISSITAWSGSFTCVGSVDPAALRKEDLPFYRKVALGATGLDSLHTLFQEKKHRRLFVRGWAAYVMCDAIFRALPSETNPGSRARDCFVNMPSSEGIRTLEDNLTVIAPAKMNDWRAFTFVLFSQANRNGGIPDWASSIIRRECRRVLSVIEPWVQSKKGHDAEKRLVAIFEEAVKLSHVLRKQRASWEVRFLQVVRADTSVPGGILPYNIAYMESNEDDDGDDEEGAMLGQRAVEMVITPALVKRGNADGELIEVETCMTRAMVVLANDLLIS